MYGLEGVTLKWGALTRRGGAGMEGGKWIDDERSPNCCSPIYPRETAAPVQRPLWKDVLWGRERGHDLAFGRQDVHTVTDTSRYIDFEFDSGCGSD